MHKEYRRGIGAVAQVVDNTLQMRSAGTVTITASQSGDDSWLPAADISRVLVVKDLQPISGSQKQPAKGSLTLKNSKPFVIGGAAVIATGILIGVIAAASGSNDDSSDRPAIIDDRPPHDPGL